MIYNVSNVILLFQSTFPRRERRSSASLHYILMLISIHVPTKGTTDIEVSYIADTKFQSTFPRRERQHFSTIFPKILLLNITILHSSLVFSYRKNIKFIFFIHFCAFFLVRISLDFHVHLLLAHSFIESVFHLLQFLYLHQHVLLLFYIDFPNSKISNYLLLHQ